MTPTMFYTDPHIGLSRAANTTRHSSALWRDTIFNQASDLAGAYKHTGWSVMCGGDVFDKNSNSEATIAQGTELLLNTDLVISGNHDVVNSVNGFGSLQLVHQQMNTLGSNSTAIHFQPGYFGLDGVEVLTVPHCLSQKDYVKTLKAVALMANPDKVSVLMTHSNYDIPPHWVRGDVTLNIEPALATELLDGDVDYLLIGHEHTMKTAQDGRVILPGCPYPTGFDNIEDKYIYELVDGVMTAKKVWSKADLYREVAPYEVTEEGVGDDVQFVLVRGEIEATSMLDLMRRVGKMWSKFENIRGLKLDVKTSGSTIAREINDADGGPRLLDLRERVASELQSRPDLMGLWNRLQEGQL